MARIEKPRIYPLRVDGVLVGSSGQPWEPAPRYQGIGPIARKALQNMKPAQGDTAKSRVYWAAHRIAQKEKIELMGYSPPGWFGARKKREKKRQWLPGEHVNHSKGTKNPA